MGVNRASWLKRLGILAAALGLLSLANPAAAQYITYVASNGNDANACTVITAPCKTLQRAVTVTSANGTVRVLTPLVSSVFINKSITIDGAGNTIVGQITIGGATAVVTLRGLALNGVGGYANGIRIDSAAAVQIQNCTVERYTGDGIKLVATTATKLSVSDTVSHDNGGRGLLVDDTSAEVTVEDSRFERNGSHALYLRAFGANVTRSAASGNIAGIYLVGGTTNIREATAVGNAGAGFNVDGGAGATLTASVARANLIGLVLAAGTSATITDSVLTNNSYGIQNYGSLTMANTVIGGNPTAAIYNNGSLYTRQNNTVGGPINGSTGLTPYGGT